MVHVSRTSDEKINVVRKFDSLESCLITIRMETGVEQFVVSKEIPYGVKDKADWYVEIYDSWRE